MEKIINEFNLNSSINPNNNANPNKINNNNNSSKNPFAGMVNSGSNSRFSTGRKG